MKFSDCVWPEQFPCYEHNIPSHSGIVRRPVVGCVPFHTEAVVRLLGCVNDKACGKYVAGSLLLIGARLVGKPFQPLSHVALNLEYLWPHGWNAVYHRMTGWGSNPDQPPYPVADFDMDIPEPQSQVQLCRSCASVNDVKYARFCYDCGIGL